MANKDNIMEFPDGGAIEEEAAVWALRFDGGPLTVEERAKFSAWLKQSTIHRDAFERISATWNAADALEDYNLIDPLEDVSPPFRRSGRSLSLVGAIAASLLFVVIAGASLTGHWPQPMQSEEFQTAIGEQKTVALIDGSRMLLNTDTELRVDIADRSRTIQLLRGEAHFEVAADAKRPFRVYAGRGFVEAIGTAFTVRVRETDVEITVAEGIVEIFAQDEGSNTGAGSAIIEAGPAYRSLTVLTVNESAVFHDAVERREKLDQAAIGRKLMWREGFLAFSGDALIDVVSEMRRYTDVRIEIADPALAAMPIAGSYEAGNIDGMFESLEFVYGIKAVERAPRHVVLQKDV